MPRIRSIKPEFWNDSKLALTCSRDARLLFISLWNFADDKGRAKAHPAVVKAQALPFDECSHSAVAGWLGELEKGGFIRRYHADGEQYLEIRTFRKHQHIQHPSKGSYMPVPPDDLWRSEAPSDARSVSTHITISDQDHMNKEKDTDQDLDQETDLDPTSAAPMVAPPGAAADSVPVVEAKPGQAPPPEANPARPELKLEQQPPPGKAKRRKRADAPPNEWARLTDELVGYRATVPKFECDWDDSFSETTSEAIVAVSQAVAHVAEKHAVEKQRARELLLQACVLYLRDDWPGEMDKRPPWSLWVFLKHKHLDEFVARALRLAWRLDDGTGRWESGAG